MIRFPRPLRPGDRIGVTAPSSGVPVDLRPRLDVAVGTLRDRGYDVVLGECLGAEGHVSAPKAERAAELTSMLTDPTIRAVVPPWGGEVGTDLLDQLDWEALAAAEPTWLVGYSDTTTLMLPLTLRLGWATLHGGNLMDTPYEAPEGLLHWTEIAAGAGPFTQSGHGWHRSGGFDDWQSDPMLSRHTLDAPGTWSVLEPGPLDVSGRLIGGCIETVSQIAASPFGDVPAFGAAVPEGLVVYLEACEDTAFTIARALHGLRHAGWFEHANAVLVGRTRATDADGFTQRDAVADALGGLGIPVVLDVECGHVPPFLPLVNGALARVVVDDDRHEITQRIEAW